MDASVVSAVAHWLFCLGVSSSAVDMKVEEPAVRVKAPQPTMCAAAR